MLRLSISQFDPELTSAGFYCAEAEASRPDARRLPGPERHALGGHSRRRSLPRLYVTSHSRVPPPV
jgi:hypothetical protein